MCTIFNIQDLWFLELYESIITLLVYDNLAIIKYLCSYNYVL